MNKIEKRMEELNYYAEVWGIHCNTARQREAQGRVRGTAVDCEGSWSNVPLG